MVKIPDYRAEPQPVLVNCLEVYRLPDDEEYIVQFQTLNGNFTSFVPKQHVIPEGKFLHAFIIGDVAEGFLVDIPAETLTSSPRLLVRHSESDTVLTFKDWTDQNGSK